MNRREEQRDTDIARTLGLLDELARIEVSPRFRTQLLQRIASMEQKKRSGFSVSASFSPRVAFFSLLLILNLASALLLFNHDKTESPVASAATVGIAESVNDEYGGPALSYYDDQSATGQ
ncbi:MAG: hypothetical protein HGA97_02120 [Chlorobiaceae bacterium]|nr:hypothetical protein [Chlorobiaceae bacterium]